MECRFKTADWDYGGLTIDEVARRIAEDDPEFEAHREHIEALAIRVMELLNAGAKIACPKCGRYWAEREGEG